MAELILTDEEKETASYLEWDNESIGKGCKKLALIIENYEGDTAMKIQASALVLAGLAHSTDNSEMSITLDGITALGEEIGTWIVTAKRVEE